MRWQDLEDLAQWRILRRFRISFPLLIRSCCCCYCCFSCYCCCCCCKPVYRTILSSTPVSQQQWLWEQEGKGVARGRGLPLTVNVWEGECGRGLSGGYRGKPPAAQRSEKSVTLCPTLQVHGRVPRGLLPRVIVRVGVRGALQHEAAPARLLRPAGAMPLSASFS